MKSKKLYVQNIAKDLQLAGIDAPLDEAKHALEKEGNQLFTLEEIAQMAMKKGDCSKIYQEGGWVKEAVIYLPNKGVYLTKNSPILENVEEATACHKNDKQFLLSPQQIESSLVGALDVSQTIDNHYNAYSGEDIGKYAFGKYAIEYLKFIKNGYSGYSSPYLYLSGWKVGEVVEMRGDKPFAIQVLFEGNTLWGTRDALNANYTVHGWKGNWESLKDVEPTDEPYTDRWGESSAPKPKYYGGPPTLGR